MVAYGSLNCYVTLSIEFNLIREGERRRKRKKERERENRGRGGRKKKEKERVLAKNMCPRV